MRRRSGNVRVAAALQEQRRQGLGHGEPRRLVELVSPPARVAELRRASPAGSRCASSVRREPRLATVNGRRPLRLGSLLVVVGVVAAGCKSVAPPTAPPVQQQRAVG